MMIDPRDFFEKSNPLKMSYMKIMLCKVSYNIVF